MNKSRSLLAAPIVTFLVLLSMAAYTPTPATLPANQTFTGNNTFSGNTLLSGSNNISGHLTVPTCTWATRPNATNNAGETVFISDVGIQGSYWFTKNNDWFPVNGSVVLYMTAVQNTAANANSTSQIFILTNTLPARILGSNGVVSLAATCSCNISATAKTGVWTFGGTTMLSGAFSGGVQVGYNATVCNRGATGSQINISAPDFTGNTASWITASIDTTAAVNCIFSLTKALGTDTATVERIQVTLTKAN